jgi:hypothetical protein
LRIPDPGERQRRDIDIILLTKRSVSLCFPVFASDVSTMVGR